MSTPNAVELSPLTPYGLAQRVVADLHPGRSSAALCFAMVALADAATGKLAAHTALEHLRGLADRARPDHDADEIRHVLAAVGVR